VAGARALFSSFYNHIFQNQLIEVIKSNRFLINECLVPALGSLQLHFSANLAVDLSRRKPSPSSSLTFATCPLL